MVIVLPKEAHHPTLASETPKLVINCTMEQNLIVTLVGKIQSFTDVYCYN